MANPSTTLSALIAFAAVAGAVCWPLYQQNRKRYEQAAPEASVGPGGAPGRASYDLPTNAGAPTSGGTLVDSMDPRSEQAINPNSTEGRILSQMRQDVDRLRQENADLRKQLSDALIAKQPPPSVEQIFQKVSLLSNKPFKTPPEVLAVPMEEISTRVMERVKGEMTPEASLVRTRSYQALGLVPEANYNFSELLSEIAAEQWQSWYDVEKNTLYYQNDADLRRMDGRYRLVSGAFSALLAQHFPSYHNLRYADAQDDAARALRALILGEINTLRSEWDTQDDFMNLLEGTDSPVSYPPSSGPHFIMEEHKRTVDAGKHFVEHLLQSVLGKEHMERAYKHPPQSTTEILHPELYLSNPPFVARQIHFPDPALAGKQPLYTNVMGELGTQIMLSRFGTPELAATTAEGWLGDRYYIYDGADPVNADVFWQTAWQTPQDAKEFYEAMCRILPRRFSIPLKKEYFQATSFTIKDPNRVIIVKLVPDTQTVSIITAGSVAAGEALDAKFNAGS